MGRVRKPAEAVKPDIDYRLNPARSIQVNGVIDDQLISKLAPEILALRRGNLEPITVYINSPGGMVRSMETLLALLQTRDQDGNAPRILTVVFGIAGSAAATLLGLGDYAVARVKPLMIGCRKKLSPKCSRSGILPFRSAADFSRRRTPCRHTTPIGSELSTKSWQPVCRHVVKFRRLND